MKGPQMVIKLIALIPASEGPFMNTVTLELANFKLQTAAFAQPFNFQTGKIKCARISLSCFAGATIKE